MGSWCNMKECALSHMPSSKANFKNVENWKVLKMWGLLKQYVYYEDLMSVLKYHLCWLRNSTVKLSDGTIWLCALSCMTSSIANYKKNWNSDNCSKFGFHKGNNFSIKVFCTL